MSDRLTTGRAAAAMRALGYDVREGDDVAITDGVADSRKASPGALFTAFRGESLDGNDYVDDALERGAVCVICERPPERDWPGRTIIVAGDARDAVGQLAAAWLRECGPKVAGITGTVGKTTAKELTAAILERRYRTHRSKENFNSLEGLPLALVTLRRSDEVSVLELAMDRPGEIRALCELVRPDVGVVMNIGLTHAAKLGSIEAIAEEKLSLPRWLGPVGTAVLNMDDPRVAAGAEGLRCRVIGFGASEGAALRAAHIEERGLDGTAFEVNYEGAQLAARSPLPGAHTVPAALAGLGTALAVGMDLREAVDALAETTYRGRMTVRPGLRGSVILDDRYNSSPASLEGALRLLKGLGRPRIALLGMMAELGEDEAAEHRRLGVVAAECCDVLAGTGQLCRDLVGAAKDAGLEDAAWFVHKEDAAKSVRKHLVEGAHVLVKASRSQAFEELIPMLEAAP